MKNCYSKKCVHCQGKEQEDCKTLEDQILVDLDMYKDNSMNVFLKEMRVSVNCN